MSATYAATLPYPLGVNRLYRSVNGRAILSREGREWKDRAAIAALLGRGPTECQLPFTGPVAVSIALYRPARRGDIDGGLKVCLDALNGIAYVDDRQVERLMVTRHEDPTNPRAEVTVEPAGAEG